ncbi:MAG: hypothetical protein U9R34_06105 [Nanoarchaeota archaeon]|nr:hypothetical protein [Nanoarchaeota archaeon]
MRKGQISTFIILGLVILMVFCFTFYFAYKFHFYYENIEDFDNVKNFLDSCISDNIEKEIRLLALKGFDANPHYIADIKNANITLLKKSSLNLVPSIESIEKQLEDSLKNRYSKCISDSYNQFRGIKIEDKNSVFKISINDNDILAEAKLSTKISKGGGSTKYKQFISHKDIRLGYIVSLINASIYQMIEKGYDIEKLELIREDLEVNITRYNSGNIFRVIDPNSNLNGKPLQIIYAVE